MNRNLKIHLLTIAWITAIVGTIFLLRWVCSFFDTNDIILTVMIVIVGGLSYIVAWSIIVSIADEEETKEEKAQRLERERKTGESSLS
jgi:SNF family Na+-dependent transporter